MKIVLIAMSFAAFLCIVYGSAIIIAKAVSAA